MDSRFTRLWTASTISNLGDGVVFAAFPLIVASLTRDPIAVSVLAFSLRLPWLLFALPAGAIVDRNDRRRLMVGADLVRATALAILAVALATGDPSLLVLYLVGFLVGMAETIFDSAAEAFLPAIVEPPSLSKANGRLVSARWVANSFIGPPLGAGLFVAAIWLPVAVDAITFLAAAILVVSIAGSFSADRAPQAKTMRADIGEGVRWLWNHRLLRATALMAGGYNLVVSGMVAILVLFAQDEVGLSDLGFGIVLAALGVGGLVGGLVAGRIEQWAGTANALILGIVTAAMAATTMGFTSNALVLGGSIFAFGITTTLWNVVAISLRQELTPDALRGRAAAAGKMIAFGAEPIGALIGGLVAAWIGLRAPVLVAGAGLAVMALAALPVINQRAIDDARAAAATD
ncbi:MAG: MFS transporter [Acidimicrobiia bacterium]|nr:MFS transporter [Acidimicrobiia bacterium]